MMGSGHVLVEDGPVVWLRCEPEVLATRVLMEERHELYSETATDVVDTDDPGIAHVVSAVIEIWDR